jgi:DNA repair protein RadC
MTPNITIFKVTRPAKRVELKDANAVAEYAAKYRDASREIFLSLYLNTKNGLVHEELHSIGTVDSAVITPREVVRLALEKNASTIVFVHNHPSGNPDPSVEDRTITKRLFEACRLFDIKVLDHVILGEDKFYSFAAQGDLWSIELMASKEKN